MVDHAPRALAGARRIRRCRRRRTAPCRGAAVAALSEILAVPRRDLEDQLDASASHDWRADPFARGAYSYIGVGGIGAPRALARPVEGTLFFAGEATDGPQIGTVAGALASGRRAAREVLRVLQ